MSATYIEQPINKVRVKPILTNAPSHSRGMSNAIERRLDDPKGSNSLGAIAPDSHQSTLVEKNHAPTKEKAQLHRSLWRLSKVVDTTRSIVPLAVGALALEAVLTFTFDSIEGLFFIISTLTVGTSVYVSDSMKK